MSDLINSSYSRLSGSLTKSTTDLLAKLREKEMSGIVDPEIENGLNSIIQGITPKTASLEGRTAYCTDLEKCSAALREECTLRKTFIDRFRAKKIEVISSTPTSSAISKKESLQKIDQYCSEIVEGKKVRKGVKQLSKDEVVKHFRLLMEEYEKVRGVLSKSEKTALDRKIEEQLEQNSRQAIRTETRLVPLFEMQNEWLKDEKHTLTQLTDRNAPGAEECFVKLDSLEESWKATEKATLPTTISDTVDDTSEEELQDPLSRQSNFRWPLAIVSLIGGACALHRLYQTQVLVHRIACLIGFCAVK
jgi:hypothetical protein